MVIEAFKISDFKFFLENEMWLAYIEGKFIVKKKSYLPLFCGFDIETTKTPNNHSFMWCWSFSFKRRNEETITIIGRTWELFETLVELFNRGLRKYKCYCLCGVANLGFEFQFICKRFEFKNFFAMERRRPVKFEIEKICFFDVLLISGRNLEHLAKNYTKTKKLVGDLDYAKQRNSKTPFVENERQYVINDTVIVSEYCEFLYINYWINGFIPLTKTGILRNEIKQAIPKEWKNKIFKTYLKNREMYDFFFKWLFRGGFTHANALYVGEVLENIFGDDFTSSYPFVMLSEKFPISEPKETKPENWEKYINNKYMHCCAVLEFQGLCAKMCHSVESEHKCIYLKNAIVDNGRIQKADTCTVFLTELDFKVYKMFYDWESVKCLKCWVFRSDYLPKYFTDVIKKYYCIKAKLKNEGLEKTPEYSVSKEMVNAAYGLTVTKLNFTEIDFVNGEWVEVETKQDYQKIIGKETLNPMWGIYVTSYARYNLLGVVAVMGNNAVYCDTDSVYYKYTKECKKAIEDYNCSVDRKEKCKDWKDTPFDGLGKFDPLKKSVKFKTLGAKRYLKQLENGEIEQTIAGVPKGLLVKYCEEKEIDPFKFFNRNMYIPQIFDYWDNDDNKEKEQQNKLRSKYEDYETSETVIDEWGNVEEMKEKSSITLLPVDFTLTMSVYFLELVKMIKDKEKGRKRYVR